MKLWSDIKKKEKNERLNFKPSFTGFSVFFILTKLANTFFFDLKRQDGSGYAYGEYVEYLF